MAGVAITALLIGFFIGSELVKPDMPPPVNSKTDENEVSTNITVETRKGGYQYINPLLECDNAKHSKGISLTLLEKKLNEYIQRSYNEKLTTHISVYFRDLNTGAWTGVKENETYAPASLLKLPLMIAVLKKAESDLSVLQKELVYQTPYHTDMEYFISNPYPLQLGKSYKVEELIYRMMVYSDNESKGLLYDFVGEQFVYAVTAELGINLSGIDLNENSISVRIYSKYFRLLYNATYLNKEMSEKALSIMSNAVFDLGLGAGIPKNIGLSNKFGERGTKHNNVKQLHDCGIIYYPGSPYLLCVMTRGNDFSTLAQVLAEISQLVYENVDSGITVVN